MPPLQLPLTATSLNNLQPLLKHQLRTGTKPPTIMDSSPPTNYQHPTVTDEDSGAPNGTPTQPLNRPPNNAPSTPIPNPPPPGGGVPAAPPPANGTGPAPPAAGGSGGINLTFRDHQAFELTFKLKPTTKLGKAMNAFATKSERERHTLRFLFEGQRVLDDSTMEGVSILPPELGLRRARDLGPVFRCVC